MTVALLIVHGLVAVALLGAITHQTVAGWAPAGARAGSFVARFRAVKPARFANAIVLLYGLVVVLGAVLYLDFRVAVRPQLEQGGHWPAIGLFDIKEHFASIGLALLPAYWVSWRWPLPAESGRTRVALTSILAVIVWWSFLVGHVLNDILGFGQ